jgi:hypothetical protein
MQHHGYPSKRLAPRRDGDAEIGIPRTYARLGTAEL